MNWFNYQEIIFGYWRKLWEMLMALLFPYRRAASGSGRRVWHTTSYFYALLKSSWYHWRCELPAGRFIFFLYLIIIGTGTTLLFLSQYNELKLGTFNIDDLLSTLPERWQAAEAEGNLAAKSYTEFLCWMFSTAIDQFLFFWHNGHLGPFNQHNLNILVDALFTATSATCLTGMTTTDITKYPPLIILALVLAGAGSLMVIALSFNINSFFQTESSSHGALSLQEYSDGRRIGRFTIKAMYGFIMLGILALTLYFLPPNSIITFIKAETNRILVSIQENFIYIFVWASIIALILLIISRIWFHIKPYFIRLIQQDLFYYLGISTFIIGIILWLYYAEGHWSLKEFFTALYHAVWLSISAFTNAGFDTYTGDLNARLGTLHASQILTVCIMLLIFFGSLGMQVVQELPHVFAELYRTITSKRFSLKRLGMKISFNTKLILLTNIFLWLFGGFMFWFLESTKGTQFISMSSSEVFFTSAFQAINMRTAGFSIRADVGAYTHPTLMLIMLMMLIGGSPNSMSGGMKVSTVATLFLVAKSILTRDNEVRAFGETLNEETISKAMTTFVLTICSLAVAIMLIFSFYDGIQEDYFKVAFDVVGAFTTIGLNTGISDWNIPCKLILIVCMCFGKIGVLTIGMTMYNTSYKKRGKK